MDFDQYQQEIAEYGDKFTANHQPGWELFLATGLCEEAGEVTALIRKAHRRGIPVGANSLAEELGDVLCYVAYIAHRYDLSLEKIASENINYKVKTNHHVQ
ncbi:MAG: hypothetical protein HC862_21885 [Scytonema sp. RU_4_4]|nr:hypothetical protein [Scytonema sp. RU_4_4]